MTQTAKFTRISILAALAGALLLTVPAPSAEACGYSPRYSAMYAISDFYGGTLEKVDPTEDVPVLEMLWFRTTKEGGVALVEINDGIDKTIEFVTLKRKNYSEMVVANIEDAPKTTRALLKWLDSIRRA